MGDAESLDVSPIPSVVEVRREVTDQDRFAAETEKEAANAAFKGVCKCARPQP